MFKLLIKSEKAEKSGFSAESRLSVELWRSRQSRGGHRVHLVCESSTTRRRRQKKTTPQQHHQKCSATTYYCRLVEYSYTKVTSQCQCVLKLQQIGLVLARRMFLSVLPGVVVSNVSLVGQSRTKTTYKFRTVIYT